MKQFLFVFLGLMSAASTSAAEELSVRSGEHPTFSRLTLPIDPEQKWTAHRTNTGVEIVLSGHSDGFETQTVFARMRRDRIAELVTTSDTLDIRFDCDCEATAFVSAGLLVIDVADLGTPLASKAITSPAPVSTPRRLPSVPTMAANPLPWIGSSGPMLTVGSERTMSATTAANDDRSAQTPDIAARAELLREMQQSLLEEVSSAASSGLLRNSYEVPERSTPSSANVLTPVEPQLQEVEPPHDEQRRNLRITSSMDMPPGRSSSQLQLMTSGINCPSDDFLAVDTWGGSGNFAVEIGRARDSLFDARDHLDPNAAVALAKAYIYFGFGAEALDALRLDDAMIVKNAELVALATILERGHIYGPNPLGAYTDCGTDVALWATLGYRELPDGIQIDTKSVLRAVNKLPGHLRHFLVPTLSDRLLEYGDSAAAAMAMRSVERLPEPLSPQGTLAQARIAVQNGTPASELLERVIDTNSEHSPEALVALVNAQLGADEPLSPETAKLVEAYVQELRGTEMGQQLRKTQVLALSQSGQFEAAFSALDDLAPSLSQEDALDIRQDILQHLSQRGDNFEFLDQMFRQESSNLAQMAATTKLLLAERLLTLGFAAQVQELLASIPDRPRNTERQLLAAQAALMLQQPFQAQAALIGIEGPQAARLMAQAKEMTGAYSEASALFTESDAPEDATRAAWLSDEWQTLIAADTPGFGALTQIATQDPTALPANTGPLGRAGAALEESQTTRNALASLLNDPLLAVTSGQEDANQ